MTQSARQVKVCANRNEKYVWQLICLKFGRLHEYGELPEPICRKVVRFQALLYEVAF